MFCFSEESRDQTSVVFMTVDLRERRQGIIRARWSIADRAVMPVHGASSSRDV